MKYRLRKIPDPILRETMPEWDFSTGDPVELRRLLTAMRLTLKVHGGVGLAANQIGARTRAIVWSHPGSVGYAVNPEILYPVGEQRGIEGCLSIPGRTGRITRPREAELFGYKSDGMAFQIPVHDHTLRIICHEVDHLNGILWTDHLNGASL